MKLTDPESGEELVLRRAQRAETPSRAEMYVNSPPGATPEGDTPVFLSQQGERQEPTVVGLATGPKLSEQAGYSSDWKTALAEYTQRLEAFSHSRQLGGYTFTDDHHDRTYNVLVKRLEWEYEAGSTYQVSYEMELERGKGVAPANLGGFSVGSATPGGDWSVGGVTLDRFQHASVVRETQTNTAVSAFDDDPSGNQVKTESAAPRVVEFRGEATGTLSERNGFDDSMRALIKNETVTLQTHFPGYSITGMVTEFEPEREASDGTNRHSYSFAFHQGVRA